MQEEQNRFHLQRVSEAESLSLATPSIVNVFCFLSLSSPSQFFTCRGCLWPSFFLFAFSPPGPFMERKLPFEALAIESVSWEHSKQERPTGQLGTENF